MILVLGTRGPGFNSRIAPFYLLILIKLSIIMWICLPPSSKCWVPALLYCLLLLNTHEPSNRILFRLGIFDITCTTNWNRATNPNILCKKHHHSRVYRKDSLLPRGAIPAFCHNLKPINFQKDHRKSDWGQFKDWSDRLCLGSHMNVNWNWTECPICRRCICECHMKIFDRLSMKHILTHWRMESFRGIEYCWHYWLHFEFKVWFFWRWLKSILGWSSSNSIMCACRCLYWHRRMNFQDSPCRPMKSLRSIYHLHNLYTNFHHKKGFFMGNFICFDSWLLLIAIIECLR